MVTGRLRQRSWETTEGDKRSVTELEADEIGASLKWATAKVERSSQRGNGQRDQSREWAAERGGDRHDAPPFEQPFDAVRAPRQRPGGTAYSTPAGEQGSVRSPAPLPRMLSSPGR